MVKLELSDIEYAVIRTALSDMVNNGCRDSLIRQRADNILHRVDREHMNQNISFFKKE